MRAEPHSTGHCIDCQRRMVPLWTYRHNVDTYRAQGVVRHAAGGRCCRCYTQHKTNPDTSRGPVKPHAARPANCIQCGAGPMAPRSAKPPAVRYGGHGMCEPCYRRANPRQKKRIPSPAPARKTPAPLSDSDVARLRRMVGVA